MNKYFFSFLLFKSIICIALEHDILKMAIDEDDYKLIQERLDEDLDVNTILTIRVSSKLILKYSLLSYALRQGSEKVVDILIDKGADLNILNKQMVSDCNDEFIDKINNITPLGVALHSEVGLGIIKRLLKHGACFPLGKSLFLEIVSPHVSPAKKGFLINYLFTEFGDNILPAAITQNNLNLIHILILNGAKIPANILTLAQELNVKKEIIEYLQYQIDLSGVITSSTTISQDVAQTIAQYSYSRIYDLNTLLIEAMSEKNYIYIKDFLEKEGDPNYCFKAKENTSERTLLLFAILYNAEEIAKLLIEKGADVNLSMNNCNGNIESPLLAAFKNEKTSLDFIQFLIDKGANIENIQLKRKSKVYNIAYLLTLPDIDETKKYFILNFLSKKFGENVLEFVLQNPDIPLNRIKQFIEYADAKISTNIIQNLKKLDYPSQTINYLTNYSNLWPALPTNMPSDLICKINDYCTEEKPKERCVVSF